MSTLNILKQMGASAENALAYSTQFDIFSKLYGINTPKRVAAFIANILNETGNLSTFEENLNYSSLALVKVWPSHFYTGDGSKNTPNANGCYDGESFGRNASHPANVAGIANVAYGNRGGNGNFQSGDGYKYRGRGPIQITFRSGYATAQQRTGIPLIDKPELLLQPDIGMKVSCIYFSTPAILKFSDVGDITSVRTIINGGTIGLTNTINIYNKILPLLGGIA